MSDFHVVTIKKGSSAQSVGDLMGIVRDSSRPKNSFAWS
jgi:hypothetical protein